MKRRFRNSSRQIGRLGLRTLLVSATIGMLAFIAISLFLIHFFRNEDGKAIGDPMVVTDSRIIADSSTLYRGSSLQLLSGIKISAKGSSNKLSVTSFTFSNQINEALASKLIRNLRLWSTASSDQFSPSRQLGNTIAQLYQSTFTFDLNQSLQQGDNYFWLTADIESDATIDAEYLQITCIATKIGTLSYDPIPPSRRLVHKLLKNKPYYSTGNADISDLKAWNSRRDGAGEPLLSFSNPNATFHIQPGHILTNRLSGCLPTLIVERNGVLQSTSSVKSDLLEVQPGGIFFQLEKIVDPSNPKILSLKNGSQFVNQQSGYLPGKQKRFDKQSVVILKDFSNQTFSQSVTWGNVIIDNDNMESVDFANGLKKVQGDLEIRKTGSKATIFTSTSDSIFIGGNLQMTGGHLAIGSKDGNSTLIIGDQLNIRNGSLSDRIPEIKSSGNLHLIAGNLVQIKDGELLLEGEHSQILLTRSGICNWKQGEFNVILPNLMISAGAVLNVIGEKIGMIAKNKELVVLKDGQLKLNEAVLFGMGSFRLEPLGTIATANPAGLNSDGWFGAIQTAKRHFSSHSVYIFDGNSNLQETGIFYTVPQPNTVKDFVIFKQSHSAVVKMMQSFHINGRFIQKSGSVNKNSFQLTTNLARKEN